MNKGYFGTLILNIAEYSSLEVGNKSVSTFQFIDDDGNDIEDPAEESLDDVMMEGSWFVKLIFEGIEDYEPYE